jgi:hypothetical protein
MKFFIMPQSLSLCRVRVVGEGLLEESLKLFCPRPRVALEAPYSCRDALHVGVVLVIMVGNSSGPLRTPPSPLLAALDDLDGALGGDCNTLATPGLVVVTPTTPLGS